jgi:hypothetical protein
VPNKSALATPPPEIAAGYWTATLRSPAVFRHQTSRLLHDHLLCFFAVQRNQLHEQRYEVHPLLAVGTYGR